MNASCASALDWLCVMGVPIRPMGTVEGPYRELCRLGLARVKFIRGGFYFVPTERGLKSWQERR